MRTKVKMNRLMCGDLSTHKHGLKEIIRGYTFRTKKDYDRACKDPWANVWDIPDSAIRATITVIVETEEKNGTLKTEKQD